MIIRGREYDFSSNVYIMGILNVTPDSFSDGGKHNEKNLALEKALSMIEEGAQIIDIGGESTRPGFEYVSTEEEIARVVPVIEAIRDRDKDIVISVDTTKSEVARAAIEAGADIINDVSGFLLDDKMVDVCIEYNVPAVLMHDSGYFNEGSGYYREDLAQYQKNRAEFSDAGNYIERLVSELGIICDRAIEKGFDHDLIIVDPGVGFGKTREENLIAIRDLDKVCQMGYPVLLGCSRKSVVGLSLELPVTQRVEGTIVTSIYGAMKGAGILRVHDVKENNRAVNMFKAIEYLSVNPSK